MDERVRELARNLIGYSVRLQPQEKILIELFDDGLPLAKELIKEAYRVGGIPFVTIKSNSILRQLLKEATIEQLKMIALWEAARMDSMDAYIGVRSAQNISELADVPAEKMQWYQQYWSKPVHTDIRVTKKWCVLRYPNNSMAQLANTSQEAFEDFYFNVCNLNYAKMDQAMEPLIQLLDATDKVHIIGPGTDLHFSIKGIPAVKCSGHINIPDGEVYTAPVKDSVNGYLTYNTPSLQGGITYEHVRFDFVNGKIVNATANQTENLNKVLDTDEGARYIGEFAFGVNPYITTSMNDILFDEKIRGSFHFTPGNSYQNAFNGNRSAVHWDLVCIQTQEYGGGEIWFDDRLIRKDGLFVIPELAGLNPENLL
ncbi:Aminopeptidase PepS [Sporomusa rhizae]|uniref:aminopeptidase n=1 Tax=Sporomusa rhizae TaxID=357999 RepID=UPI00352AE0EA